MGAKVDGAYNNLIQGVSQQVPTDRVEGQCSILENFNCDPEKGLLRRAPAEWVGALVASNSAYKVYNCTVDGTDVLLMVRDDGTGQVLVAEIDKLGTPGYTAQTVVVLEDVRDYLESGSLKLLSVNDKVYIANTSIPTQMDTSNLSERGTRCGVVYVRGGSYYRPYTVTITDNSAGTVWSASYTTQQGSDASHAASIQTTNIAAQLAGALTAEGLTITIIGSTIIWDYPAGVTSMSVVVSDGGGNIDLVGFTDTVQDVGDLSAFSKDGHIVKVEGNGSADVDDWYLMYLQDADLPLVRAGVWVECTKPGIPASFDLETMPHVLRKNGDQFVIEHGEWFGRRVGDDDTNPEPSFIGHTINDMCVFQGRLVFLSNDSVIMSKSNEYQEFWVNSATVLVDTDPIDISSAASDSTQVMMYAVPHNRDLVIFTEGAQFIIFGRNALTPFNTSLVLTTSYDTEIATSPVPSGKNVFYPINYGKFTGIKEFYTEGSLDVNASRPVTAHCTQYLEGKIAQLATSTTFDVLLCKTDADPTKLYVYEYLWLNETKVQSAWGTWIFPWEIVHVFFDSQKINIVYKDGYQYAMASIDLSRNDDSAGYQVHLDSRTVLTDVTTSATLPYVSTTDSLVFVQDSGCPNPGLVVNATVAGNRVSFERDMEGGTVIAGIPYKSLYVPTKPVLKDSSDRPIGTGRLLVRQFTLSYTGTGAFDVRLIGPYHDPIELRFSGFVFNTPASLIGNAPVGSGVADIPFMQDVDFTELEISTSAHTPLRINRMEYTGDYIKRGRRV